MPLLSAAHCNTSLLMKWDSKKLLAPFRRNGKLKVFSLAFAFGLWIFVNYGERDTEKTLLVPVELRNLSASLVIMGPRIDYIDLRLRGPRSLLEGIKSKRIRLDLHDVRPGMSSFRINADTLNLPRGVRVVRISPAQINLDIAQVTKRVVPVRLDTVGTLPRGYTLTTTELLPDKVEVRGPLPIVEKIQAVQTDSLDLTNLTQPVTQTVNLRGPEEETVSYSVEKVLAQVGVQEVVTTREFRQLKIEARNAAPGTAVTPEQVHVKIRGPQRLLEGINAKDIKVFVDGVGQDPGLTTAPIAIVLPPGLELVSQEPVEAVLQSVDDSKKKPRPVKPTTARRREKSTDGKR
jgi:YbbR domain-containing protein